MNYEETNDLIAEFMGMEHRHENTEKPTDVRGKFMEQFRNGGVLAALTPDDRAEIFISILQGGSDITKELLDELLSEYGVDDIIICKP